MSYFTTQQHASIAADPSVITTLYASERTRFLASLGSNFAAEPEEHFKLAFCAVFAYDHVPYGPDGGSVADPLVTLLSRANMDCDNYAAVAWGLFELLCPSHVTSVCAVGWDGGAIGNHAQIVAHKAPNGQGGDGGSILVDPTIGFIQVGYPYDWFASQKACSAAYAKSFNQGRNDGTAWLNSAVQSAMSNGSLKPSDILYVFGSIDSFKSPECSSTNWPTPAKADLEV